MVEPITVALISGAVSAGISAYTAYQNGEISEEQYRQAVAAANELERSLKRLRPGDSWENLNPELLQETAKYSPEISAFVQENAPQLITEAGSETEKRVQREALQKYAAMSETGRDVISEAQREQALFEADARAKARQQRLMEGLRRQGQLGSGAALAAQLQGEQDERQMARQEVLQGIQQAEMRRREALGQAASLAGSLRGQALQVESANVGTMNAYNQRLANARNLYNQYASGERNQAQSINQAREIARQQANVNLKNQYAMYNQQQALAARERARDFDVNLTNRMFDLRRGADAQRAAGEQQTRAGYATALSTGIGTGLSAFGAASAAKSAAAVADANKAKKAYFDSLLGGAAQGLAQRATSGQPSNYVLQSSQTGQLFNSMMPYRAPSNYIPGYSGPFRPYGQEEVWDETSESFTLPERKL